MMNGEMSENQDITTHYYGLHRKNTEAYMSKDRNEGKVYF